MKTILKSAFLLLSIVFILCACKNKEGEGKMNEPKIFETTEKAIAKAKSDLIQVLETNKDLNLGIDVDKLRKAEPARPVQFTDVDFEKLLLTETVQSLSDVSSPPKSMLAPFVLMNDVVSVVEVQAERGGWKIVGLGNKPITNDINTAKIPLNGDGAVTVYEVPNLQIFIYGVKKNSSETYYLNFDEHTLKEGVDIQAFYPALRRRAIQFQKEFGDILKKGKLLK